MDKLHVRVTHGNTNCCGIYHIVSDERPNGRPLWKNSECPLWLYSSSNGRWCIAGADVREEGFAVSAGFVTQSVLTFSKLPHECESPWQQWAWGRFVEDPGISIEVAPRPPRTAPRAAACRGPAPARRGSRRQKIRSFISWLKTLPRRRRGGTPSLPIDELEATPSLPADEPEEAPASVMLPTSVMLHIVHAAGVDLEAIDQSQRILQTKILAASRLQLGPLLQPRLFFALAATTTLSLQEPYFSLFWEPPRLYLTEPTSQIKLLVDGEVMEERTCLLESMSEVAICTRSYEHLMLVCRITHTVPAAPPASVVTPVVSIVKVMSASSPHAQAECNGDYELVPNRRPNKQPLWAKIFGSLWIYSGLDGRWYIGGPSEEAVGFNCAAGCLCNPEKHGVKLPYQLHSTWERLVNGTWSPDPAVCVAPCDCIAI